MTTTASTNYFGGNIDRFLEASTYIRRHCISFAGHDITAPCNARVFDTLARAFSNCDKAVRSMRWDCICMADCHPIPCTVDVGIDASVKFIPKR